MSDALQEPGKPLQRLIAAYAGPEDRDRYIPCFLRLDARFAEIVARQRNIEFGQMRLPWWRVSLTASLRQKGRQAKTLVEQYFNRLGRTGEKASLRF